MDSDEDSWSIHDLDNAPEPPQLDGSAAPLSPRTGRRHASSADGAQMMGVPPTIIHHGSRRRSASSGERSHFFIGSTNASSSLLTLPSAPTLSTYGQQPIGMGGSNNLDSQIKRRSGSADARISSVSFNLQESPDLHRSDTPEFLDSIDAEAQRARFDSNDSERRRNDGTEQSEDSSWNEEDEIPDEADFADSFFTRRPIIFCGFQLPLFCTSPPSLHRISTFIVRRAPCFLCVSFRQPTDRAVLARLNILLCFFSVFQVASMLFISIVTLAPEISSRTLETQTPGEADAQENRGRVIFNVWTLNGSIYALGILGFIIMTSTVMTVRVIRNVNLMGIIRYLWLLLWINPFEIYFVIGLFDYRKVTDVWVTQFWRDPAMAWFRHVFCEPHETANTLCTVPLGVNTTEWCLEHYNATNCANIRNNAQKSTETFLYLYYYINGGWGFALIIILFLVIHTLERIISKPLVQKSRESNVPAWMSLPIVACIVFGLIFSYSETSVINHDASTEAAWIGPLYLGTAGLFLTAAMLGWYISRSSIRNIRHKRNKLLSILAFIFLMILILGSLITIFAASIAFSVSLVDIPISYSERGEIACAIDDAGTCTRCDQEVDRCPEWTVTDVTKVIQSQAKASAAMAGILMLYAVAALRFGLLLRKHILMYQIDYV